MSVLIRDGLNIGLDMPARLYQTSSLEEYCANAVAYGDSDYQEDTKTALGLARDGWKEVLDGLVAAQDAATAAYSPKKVNRFNYTGHSVNVGRYLVGKPACKKPEIVLTIQEKFVRVLFLAEAFKGCSGPLFIAQTRKLLETIVRCEQEGRRVEILTTFGMYHNGKALIDGAIVKRFQDPVNLPQLSALGHPTFFHGCHFATETAQKHFPTAELPSPYFVPSGAIMSKAPYIKAFEQAFGKEYTDSLTVIDKESLMRGSFIKDLQRSGLQDGKT